MQFLAWFFRLAIVLVLVWFAVKNSDNVTLKGLPGQELEVRLVFVMLVVFVAGVVIGLLAWVPTVVRQRRELGRLRKASTILPPVVAAPPADAPADAPAEPRADIHGV